MVGRLAEGGLVGRVPQKRSWMRLPGRLKGFLNTGDHGLMVGLDMFGELPQAHELN